MQLRRITKNGAMLGKPTEHINVTAFLGIRYAAAGRWEYPRRCHSWDGIYNATSYGPTCIQATTYEPEDKSGRVFYYNEFRKDVPFHYTEDCLRLNIWTPDDAMDAPVLVYLHGGAFLGGSTQEKCFDGATLSTQGLVVVTVEFRIGILGFAAFEELVARDGHSGNYGLFDALTALGWIQENIADFGGDPVNVTLMGQSAGSRMVQMLCLSPLAQGKFQKAIMCSSAGGSDLFAAHSGIKEMDPIWRDVMKAAGFKDFVSFSNAENEVLITAFSHCVQSDFKKFSSACAPIMDGVLLPDDMDERIQNGAWAQIPYMIGSTSEDLDAPGQFAAVKRWANQSTSPCYCYHFSRQLPGDKAGAFHSADLWYWFGTLERCWRPFTRWDHELAQTMMAHLAAFAITGKGLPMWNAQSKQMMCYTDTEIKPRSADEFDLPHL